MVIEKNIPWLIIAFLITHIYSAAPMFPDVDFFDWFLWGLLGQNFWAVQYIASFWMWGTTGAYAAWRLAEEKVFDKYAASVLFVTVWYLSIQTHWVVKEAAKHPGYIEWWWSTFETAVAALLLLALCRKN